MSSQETGRLLGTVVSPDRLPAGGASVKVTNRETNARRRHAVDDDGRFLAAGLWPGWYEVVIEAPGFRRTRLADIAVRAGDAISLSIRLEIGEHAEQMTVRPETAFPDTASSAMSTVVDEKAIRALPLNRRSPFSLVLLSPAVIPNRSLALLGAYSNDFQVSGNRGMSNEVYVDGSPSTVTEGGIGSLRAVAEGRTLEGVREFRVQTGIAAAEFGGAGGIVNISTKGGSSRPHGALFEFLRNSALDANSFFGNARGARLESFRRHQAGAALGGPLRLPGAATGTFGFLSLETVNATASAPYFGSVPAIAMRRGNSRRRSGRRRDC